MQDPEHIDFTEHTFRSTAITQTRAPYECHWSCRYPAFAITTIRIYLPTHCLRFPMYCFCFLSRLNDIQLFYPKIWVFSETHNTNTKIHLASTHSQFSHKVFNENKNYFAVFRNIETHCVQCLNFMCVCIQYIYMCMFRTNIIFIVQSSACMCVCVGKFRTNILL